jgi:hypothetical protein
MSIAMSHLYAHVDMTATRWDPADWPTLPLLSPDTRAAVTHDITMLRFSRLRGHASAIPRPTTEGLVASLSNSFSSSLAELRTALTTVGNKPTTLSKADTIKVLEAAIAGLRDTPYSGANTVSGQQWMRQVTKILNRDGALGGVPGTYHPQMKYSIVLKHLGKTTLPGHRYSPHALVEHKKSKAVLEGEQPGDWFPSLETITGWLLIAFPEDRAGETLQQQFQQHRPSSFDLARFSEELTDKLTATPTTYARLP